MKKSFLVVNRSFLPYWFFTLLFVLIAGFRGGTRDTDVYAFVFNTINDYKLGIIGFYESTGMEVGFGYFAKLFYNLGLSFTFFSIFISFITFLFVKKASDNFGANAFLVLLCYIPVFFANHQLMQIRQGIAVAAVYFALSLFLSRGEKIKGTVFFLFGLFFHNIVLIFSFLNLFFIQKLLLTKKIHFYLKIIFLVAIVFLFCRLITSIGLILLTDRIANYADSTYSEERSFLHPVNIRSILLLAFFVILRPKKESKFYDFLTIIYALGIGFRLGFYDFLILSGRISTMFTFAEIFLIPLVLQERFNKLVLIFFIFIYFSMNLYINIFYQVPFIIEDYFKPIF